MAPPDWQLLDAAALGEDPEAFLSPGERAVARAFTAEKRRQDWVLGRAAAKAAVRALLRREGAAPPAPAGVVIQALPTGAPHVLPVDAGPPIVVSISHGHGLAAGWALRAGPGGGLPGLDLERVRPRREGTLRFYLSPEERAGVLALAPGADDEAGPRDDLAVRLWAVKEAAFKALRPPRGMGLLDVRAEVDDVGGARVAYTGRLLERAQALGAREVRAGWLRRGDVCVAWVQAVDAHPDRE
ncbi:MAG: 4'-phosphopantetheinyl transferase superfamily protein [Planctomycetes bacterium]|nr:4'-phosphopantetheinyl transferase superfamily protein [Planctomycetota bacterium]